MEKEPSYKTVMRDTLFFIEQQMEVEDIEKKEAICAALRIEITKTDLGE